MTSRYCAAIVIALLWAGIAGIARAQAPLLIFEPTACGFDTPPNETIECGYLSVPERHSHPQGSVIRIFVAIIRSHSPDPVPDPIIYLRGGMGQLTRWFIENGLSQIQGWLARRDVILFDQRGLGLSQPALDCPGIHEGVVQGWLGPDLPLSEQLAPRLACRDAWIQQGIDLTAYNSFETASDVKAIWQALGYEQVNLIGASYWTVVAQLVMRGQGHTGHVRSAILDSPVPLTIPVMAETPAQLSVSLARLFKNCAANWFCHYAYPDLENVYRQVMNRPKDAPAMLTGTNPLSGLPFAYPFNNEDFGFAIQYGAYRELPGLIYDVYDNNYTKLIIAREKQIRESIYKDAGQHFGFRTSQNCNEPWNAISAEQRTAMAVYPEAVFMNNSLDVALCEQWPTFDPGEQMLPSGGELISQAKGNVWIVETNGSSPFGDIAIVSSIQLANGTQYRVLGTPNAQATAAIPTLEDGYLWLMRQTTQ